MNARRNSFWKLLLLGLGLLSLATQGKAQDTTKNTAQTRAQASPLPTDTYVSAAGHVDGADVWAAWNFRSREAAEANVLTRCSAAMGAGCTISHTGYNGSIAVARQHDGSLWGSFEATPESARKLVLDQCGEGGRCRVERVFTAVRSAPGSDLARKNKEQIYGPAKGANSRLLRGAVAWTAPINGAVTLVVTGGHLSQAAAEKAAVDRCNQENSGKCTLAQWGASVSNIVYVRNDNDVRVLMYFTKSEVIKLQQDLCRQAKAKCRVIATHDFRTPGFDVYKIPLKL